MIVRKITTLFSIILVLSLLVTSCKTDTSQYRKGIYLRLENTPSDLNPLNGSTKYDSDMTSLVFNSLVELDAHTLEFTPVIATSLPEMEVLGDSLVQLTYAVREQATWPNGTPITVEDVAFSVKAQLCPLLSERGLIGRDAYKRLIRGIKLYPEAKNKISILSKKEMLFDQRVSGLTILPKYVYDEQNLLKDVSVETLLGLAEDQSQSVKDWAEAFNGVKFQRETMVGSGAYEFKEWVTNQKLVFAKKSNWWGDQLAGTSKIFEAKPEKLTYSIITEQVSSVVALKGNELDALDNVDPEIYLKELKENATVNTDFTFKEVPRRGYGYIGFNMSSEKLNDKKVRRALAHCLDIDGFVERNMSGLGQRVVTIYPPFNEKFINKKLNPIDFNLAKAKALLDEAGWKDSNGNGVRDKKINGKLTELNLAIMITRSVELRIKLLEQFQAELQKIGVKLDLQKVEFDNLIDDVNQKKYEMFSMGWSTSITEGNPYSLWSKKGEQNYVGFGNGKSEQLIENIQKELDESKRVVMQKKLQEVIYEEQPYIFLYSKTCNTAVSNDVKKTPYLSIEPGFDVSLFEKATVTQ